MKNRKYSTLIVSSLLIILLTVGIYYLLFGGHHFHKTLFSVRSCTVEDAKHYGTFLWEYEPDTFFVYDTIPVIVTSSFAQRNCQWLNYDYDSIVISPNSSYVLCSFDTSSIIAKRGFLFVKGHEYINVESRYDYDKGLPPDTLPISFFAYKHHLDSLGNVCFEVRSDGRWLSPDTIQTFYLFRK